MPERLILYCRASSWSKIIAWIQIALYSALMLTSYIYMSSIFRLAATIHLKKANKESMGASWAIVAATTALAIVLFVVATFGIIVGVILLQGARQRNTRKLRWWLIYAVMFMCLCIVTITMDSGANALDMRIGFIIVMVINAFGIWVVWVDIREIEEHLRVIAAQPPAYNDQFQCPSNITPV